MISVWPKRLFIFFIIGHAVNSNPLIPPTKLACKTLLKKSTECQITYSGWQQLTRCLKGDSVYVPDIEETITCTCTAHQPSAVTTAGLEYDSFTRPAHRSSHTSSPGPPAVPEQDETYTIKDVKISGLSHDNKDHTFRPPPPGGRGRSLADFDYVAPDGSVAMAMTAKPPGVAGLAVVVLGVLVVVLLGTVAILCCSRQSAADAFYEEEEEEEEEEEGEAGEGGEGAEEKEGTGREKEAEEEYDTRGGKGEEKETSAGKLEEGHHEESPKDGDTKGGNMSEET